MPTLTVYFEEPFWVAVLERADPDGVRAIRVVLGGEPTDPELYDLLLRHGTRLLAQLEDATPVHPTKRPPEAARNPKRLARQAAREAARRLPSTAAQEAAKRATEARAAESRARRRTRDEAADAHRRDVRRAKARARRRGH